ncbi:MAG: MATE family efflux transporter [Candidatus Marinimicrobia bacterium]|nr:MATE family efflux transporter [Candidatus Neomarinimicrobiota bacterium]
MTIPMIFGMMSMVIFNLADTFFVGKLGADELAALSFTFPVVMVVNSIAVGIGLGSSAVISKLYGQENYEEIKKYSLASLILGVIIIFTVSAIGILTISPLFKLLGADGIVLEFIKSYMQIWFMGSIFVAIPMIGNNIIRASGNTLVPGMIMLFSALANVILDPLFIFGVGPFPELGIRGAALTTVIARFGSASFAIYYLIRRIRAVSFIKIKLSKLFFIWKRVLFIGIPNALVKMALPVAAALITRLISTFGYFAVAGFGVATRIEFFAMSFIAALASILGPFIGQNLGAKKAERVKEGKKLGELFSILIGIITAILLGIFAESIAKIFSQNPKVIETTVLYFRIVPIAYGLQGVMKIGSNILNVLEKPFKATSILVLQLFILYLPLAYFTSKYFGLKGIFISLSFSYFIAGAYAHFRLDRELRVVIK